MIEVVDGKVDAMEKDEIDDLKCKDLKQVM
jgi:hypothetical protein